MCVCGVGVGGRGRGDLLQTDKSKEKSFLSTLSSDRLGLFVFHYIPALSNRLSTEIFTDYPIRFVVVVVVKISGLIKHRTSE